MSRQRWIRNASWALSIGAAAAFATASMSASQAFAAGTFSTRGEVDAIGQAAIMPGGQMPTPTVGQTAITIDWAASTFRTGKEVVGYIVNRQAPDGTNVVQVCAIAAPARTCQDSPPAGQQVTYRVIATAEHWRGPASPQSGTVSLPATPAAAALAAPTALPTPSASATPSPTPTPTPTPTDTGTPTPTPTPTTSAATSTSPSPTP